MCVVESEGTSDVAIVSDQTGRQFHSLYVSILFWECSSGYVRPCGSDVLHTVTNTDDSNRCWIAKDIKLNSRFGMKTHHTKIFMRFTPVSNPEFALRTWCYWLFTDLLPASNSPIPRPRWVCPFQHMCGQCSWSHACKSACKQFH